MRTSLRPAPPPLRGPFFRLRFVLAFCTLLGVQWGCDSSPTEPVKTNPAELLFVSARGGFHDLWAIQMDGTGLRRITDDDVTERWYAWSPDGARIAVQRTSPGPVTDLWVLNADGTDLHKVTDTPATWEGGMSWSPDGTRLAFDAPNDQGGWDVFLVDADGGSVTNLTHGGEHLNGGPRWSPDGSKILFVSLRDGNAEIYLMDPDGSGQVNITQTPDWDEGHPDWSPDGSRIAFDGSPASGGNRDVYVMDASGGGRVNVSQSPETDDLHFDWSPDGSQIAWDTNAGDPTSILYVANTDGTGKLELSPVGSGASWSPDGSRIAFNGVRQEAGKQYAEVYLIAPDGTGLQMLVTPEDPRGSVLESENPWRPASQK